MVGEGAPYEEMAVQEDENPKRMSAQQVPIPVELRNKAFELYMGHMTFDEISKATKIKRNTIKSWSARENWARLRKENDEVVLAEIVESKKALLGNLVMELLGGALKAVKRDAGRNGFKAKDVPTYLNALASIEKLSRLSLGQATSISEERTKRATFSLPAETLKQIQAVKVQDPFQLEAEQQGGQTNERQSSPADTSGSNRPS